MERRMNEAAALNPSPRFAASSKDRTGRAEDKMTICLPDARGAGIGRALLVELARTAEARACGRLEWAVLTWNEPAIGFYRELGAFPLDEWQTYRLDREGIRALAADATHPLHHD